MFSKALFYVALAGLLSCTGPVEQDLCTAHIKVRMGQNWPAEASLGHINISRDGETVYSGELDLFGAGRGAQIEVLDSSTDKAPQILAGENFVFSLSAYRPQDQIVLVQGRSAPFSCHGEVDVQVPLYAGPADRFVDTKLNFGQRSGSSSTMLGDGQVLLFGGLDQHGDLAQPVAALYDHKSGLLCTSDDADCFVGEIPAGRIGHTATALGDGRVLIVGGDDGDSMFVQEERPAFIFDLATRKFTILSLPDAVNQRSHHAAVLLQGYNVPVAYAGQVMIIGGVGIISDSADSASVLRSVYLVDVQQQSASSAGMLLQARYDFSATLMGSGEVLIAGGYKALPDLEATALVEIFQPQTGLFVAPVQGCAGDSSGELCAARAGHTATLLDDGNVLLWGGDTHSRVGHEAEDPVQAEVFMLINLYALPLRASADQMSPRLGHSATVVDCLMPPCSVVIAGGVDDLDEPLKPVLLKLPETPGTTAYGAEDIMATDAQQASLRQGHTALATEDGAVFLFGGLDESAQGFASHPAAINICAGSLDDMSLQCLGL